MSASRCTWSGYQFVAKEPPVEYRFTMRDDWNRRVLHADTSDAAETAAGKEPSSAAEHHQADEAVSPPPPKQSPPPPPPRPPNVSRNAPCLCGSGKKYKKCCEQGSA